jgi:RNA polymerase sigma-70 factor (ECF subfamily)
MTAIGEQSLTWLPQARTSAESAAAEPDLTTLVRDHSTLLYRVALSLLRNPAEAEDVVQDVFVRVLEHRGDLSDVLALRPWLVRITWNLALDRCRRVQKVRTEQMDDLFAASLASADLPIDQALSEAGQIRQVLAAMEKLPKKERQVLLLSAVDELSAAEIGAVVGRSESSVRSLLFRARAHLRQRLQD